MQFLSATLYLFAVSITTSLATPTATATSGALKARDTDEMIPANLNITIYDYPDCDTRGTNHTLNPNYEQKKPILSNTKMRFSTSTSIFLLSMLSASTLAHPLGLKERQATTPAVLSTPASAPVSTPTNSPPATTPTKPVSSPAPVAANTGSFSSSAAPPAATTGSADLTLVAFPKANCQGDAMPVTVHYGAQVQAQVLSYSLSRGLTSSEQLDFSQAVPSGQATPTGFSDFPSCASFLSTESPETNGTVLTQGCYEVGSITARCFRLWAHPS